jgi:hypothetical protein
MKTKFFIFFFALLLLLGGGYAALKLRPLPSAVDRPEGADAAIPPLGQYDYSTSFPIGRYPATVDAKQSEALVAPVSGYFSFTEEAFAGSHEDGAVLGSFRQQLEMKKEERRFLAEEFSRLKDRISRMGDLQRQNSVRQMSERIIELREHIRILKAIEANPDLEGALSLTQDVKFKGGTSDTVESAELSLKLLEAEHELLANEDSSHGSQKKTFEVESALSELDLLIQSLSATMPFEGKFTPAFPEDVLGRAVAVKNGDILGIANDDSAIYLSVVSTDPELAMLDNSAISARVRVGGREVRGEFVEKSLVEVQGRPVPAYSFLLSSGSAPMDNLIGTQVSCELYRTVDTPVASLPKLKLVQLYSDVASSNSMNWESILGEVYPNAELVTETKSSLIVREAN